MAPCLRLIAAAASVVCLLACETAWVPRTSAAPSVPAVARLMGLQGQAIQVSGAGEATNDEETDDSELPSVRPPLPSDGVPPEGTPEAELFRLINDSRAAAGLAPLIWDTELAAVARAHNQDMLLRGYFDHDTPEGEGPPERIMRAGVTAFQPGGYWAANLVVDRNVASAHASMMREPAGNSQNGRGQILDERNTRVGISVVPYGDGGVLINLLYLR